MSNDPKPMVTIPREELHLLRNRVHAAEGLLTLAKLELEEIKLQRDEAVHEVGQLRLQIGPIHLSPENKAQDDRIAEVLRVQRELQRALAGDASARLRAMFVDPQAQAEIKRDEDLAELGRPHMSPAPSAPFVLTGDHRHEISSQSDHEAKREVEREADNARRDRVAKHLRAHFCDDQAAAIADAMAYYVRVTCFAVKP